MHIALVTAYPPSKGSLNEYGFHFAKALADKPDVEKLSVIADTLKSTHEDPANIHRVWSFNNPLTAWKIHKALDQIQPDAVIFNLQFASFGDKRIPAALGLLAPWLSKRQRPSISLLHNIFETVDLDNAGFGVNPLINTVTTLAGKLFTRAILKSDLVALTMKRYIDILEDSYQAKNLFLAPHGTFETPEPIQGLPEIPTVMAFGKFGTYKKVEVLLQAHERLLQQDPRTRLVIAGTDSPNAKGYLANAQETFKHLPNVSFTGYVAENDVAKTFQNATVVAFPYESTTGSSGVLHQAGQYGRAAVMPNIGDLADLTQEEGYRASFFEPGDVDSLTTALSELLQNQEKAYMLGKLNHQAASQLTLSNVADIYLRFLKELVETKCSQNPALTLEKHYT